MHIVSIEHVNNGSVLGKTLYTADGRVLLGKGVELKSIYIKRLKDLGYYTIYVSDEFDDDFAGYDVIRETTRIEAVLKIKRMFSAAAELEEDKKYSVDSVGIIEVTQKIIDEVGFNDELMVDLMSLKSLDDYTFQHSVNVCVLATVLSLKSGFNGIEIRDTALAALLHDIGKMYIPQEILQKTTAITEEEFTEIKEHTQKGFSFLLNQANVSPKIAIVAYQHHERWDGSGYMDGITENQIHLYARVISLVDTYDALTSDRIYRRRFTNDQALEKIRTECRGKFDPDVVKALESCVVKYPSGTMVKLSTGETALVIKNNEAMLGRPVLRLVSDENGNRIHGGAVIDTAREAQVVIEEILMAQVAGGLV